MTKYTVELTDETIDYLVQAIRLQAEDAIQQLTKPRHDEIDSVADFLQSLVDRSSQEENMTQGKEDVSPQEQTISVENKVKAYAPYGLKNDGTPAKRRGRPSTKKAKA